MVEYFSEKYKAKLHAIIVDYDNSRFYIRNSGESIWINKSKAIIL